MRAAVSRFFSGIPRQTGYSNAMPHGNRKRYFHISDIWVYRKAGNDRERILSDSNQKMSVSFCSISFYSKISICHILQFLYKNIHLLPFVSSKKQSIFYPEDKFICKDIQKLNCWSIGI